MCRYSWKKVSLWALLTFFSTVSASAVDRVSIRAKADSVGRDVSFSEYTHIYRTKRVSSTYPIKIKMKGCWLRANIPRCFRCIRVMVYFTGCSD